MMRRLAVVLFAAWFVLSALPLSPPLILAAPPESPEAHDEPAASASDERRDESASAGASSLLAFRAAPDRSSDRSDAEPEADAAPRPVGRAMGSVRPRGREAPVQLRQREPDPLDGEVAPKATGAREPEARQKTQNRKPKDKEQERPERGIRIWPMPAESYTFTQAFGCVPQIAHFYQPGAGCPADAPVIHHGIDMAAPEGTPFYAAASGWVTEAGPDREVGVANTRIIIQHDDRNEDYATEYLHWIASYVEVGDYVEAGEEIGEVGSVGYSTGPHLHFSIIDLVNGGNIDPLRWLPEEAGQEGYRGRLPRERAAMRLPAGTTAGVPEWHDPAPPPPPERQEVPESPPAEERGERKKKRDRQERRERTRASDSADASNGDGDGSSARTRDERKAKKADATEKKGKDRERTRKRERNKNGRDRESAESGEDTSTTKRAKRDNRGGKNGKSNKKNDDADRGKNSGGKKSNNGKNGNKSNNNTKKKDEKREKREKGNDQVEVDPLPAEDGNDGVEETPPAEEPGDSPAETAEPPAGDAADGNEVSPSNDNPDANEGDRPRNRDKRGDRASDGQEATPADDNSGDQRREKASSPDEQVQQESSDSGNNKRRKNRDS